MNDRAVVILKLVLLFFLIGLSMFIGLLQQNISAKSGLKYESYYGEEITGDYPRLLFVDNRKDIDKDLTSTSVDRIFNDAYAKQYKDSYILSTSAHIEQYDTSDNKARVKLKFDNGAVTTTTYSKNPRYIGSITITTKIDKSAR